MLVRAGDVELNVRRAPATPTPGRPTVVCVHGFVIDDMSSFWFTLAGALSEVADVVCFDQRGHGRSPVVPTGYAVDDQVDDLFALLDALDVEGPVQLVGFSYGAAVVLAAGLRHPERVASLALLDGNYPRPGAGPRLAAMFDMVAGDLSTEGVMERLAIASRRRAERLCGRIDSLVNHTSLREDVRGEPGLPDKQLLELTMPILAVYGGASNLVPLGRHLAALVPQVEYHELPGAGHRVVVERTTQLQSLLVPWTRRHAPVPADAAVVTEARS